MYQTQQEYKKVNTNQMLMTIYVLNLSLSTDIAGRLPAPEDFSRGVYIIESGSNDYRTGHIGQVDEAMISSVLEYIEHAVRVCVYHVMFAGRQFN